MSREGWFSRIATAKMLEDFHVFYIRHRMAMHDAPAYRHYFDVYLAALRYLPPGALGDDDLFLALNAPIRFIVKVKLLLIRDNDSRLAGAALSRFSLWADYCCGFRHASLP